MTDRPTGTVTLVFTDIEGSTRLLNELGDRYASVLTEHRRLLRKAFDSHDGVEVDTQGDAFFYVFASAKEALSAAAEAQSKLRDGPVHVRIGVHTGEPLMTDEGYVGADVHRAARIAAAGHGGQVLVSATTATLVDLELRDLGIHRLKDLIAAERLYQLGHEDFPPLKTLDATSLPVAASALIGREREVSEVVSLLRDGHRLITVTGPGGTGKTRLGLQVAAELVDAYSDGVFWVPLAGVTDAHLVLPAMRHALGSRDELAHDLRERDLLLVLDSFEHLVGAASDLAEALRGASGLRLLVTSRVPLHISGEYEYPVDPLPATNAATLFVERARAVGRELDLDETVGEICARLDNLPLALELAAARTKLLDPLTLLTRLERRLPLLAGGPRDVPERQRTLRPQSRGATTSSTRTRRRSSDGLRCSPAAFRSRRAKKSGRRISMCCRDSQTRASSSPWPKVVCSCSRRSANTASNASRRQARLRGRAIGTPRTSHAWRIAAGPNSSGATTPPGVNSRFS